MKFLLRLVLVFFIISSILFCKEKIAIFDFDNRASEKLSDAKFIESKILEFAPDFIIEQFTADSNVSNAISILKELDKNNYKLIIIITSDSLRVATHILKNTPYLFTNVNNPLLLGVTDLNYPNRKRSGVSYYIPIEKHIELIKKIKPSVKKLGFIFDNTSVSRELEFKEARSYCAQKKFDFSFSLINSISELDSAVDKLINEKSDIIILTSSGIIYNNAEIITSKAYKYKIPVYSYNKYGVSKGAIASLSVSYKEIITFSLIPMIKKVLLENTDPGTLPVAFSSNPEISINLSKAKEIGLNISEEILKVSKDIY